MQCRTGRGGSQGYGYCSQDSPLCGYCDITEELTALLQRYGFDLACNYTADDMYASILSDKKRRGGNISIVLPREVGQCVLHTVTVEELKELLNKVI